MKKSITELNANEAAVVHGGLWICREQMMYFAIFFVVGTQLPRISEVTTSVVANNIVWVLQDLSLVPVIGVPMLVVSRYLAGKIDLS